MSERFKQQVRYYREQLPDDRRNAFEDLVAEGRSPRIAVAAIEYILDEYSGEKAARRYNVTGPGVRRAEEHARTVLERYDLVKE